jgi:molybdenum cofactor sulfurtransferase
VSTTNRITSIRLRVLELFNANPELFDVVFVANATAGIKLIADGFFGCRKGFRYKYLRDAHTSLVGVVALAQESKCLSEAEVKDWIDKRHIVKEDEKSGLFAYPAQSNFNGRRFPIEWVPRLREMGWFSLLDAASYLTTTPLNYSDPTTAPDFTVLSFYKIFGYPDLGAIIVRRDAGHILLQRRYFGGGTRAAVTSDSFQAARKELHEALEDGTLPFHTILALDPSISNFTRLFGSHVNVSRHTAQVSRLMYTLLSSLRHHNGRRVCQLYSSLVDSGPIIAFNLLSASGSPIGFASFEKLSSLRNIALRTGGMCNPGGVEQYLNLQSWEVERNFGRGKVCGDDVDVVEGKNTGVIRVSFGACSTVQEVCAFVDFIREFYIEKESISMGTTESIPSMTIQSVNLCIFQLL